MHLAKTKEDLLEFNVNLASEVESHETTGDKSININENILKHRTKIRKETFN